MNDNHKPPATNPDGPSGSLPRPVRRFPRIVRMRVQWIGSDGEDSWQDVTVLMIWWRDAFWGAAKYAAIHKSERTSTGKFLRKKGWIAVSAWHNPKPERRFISA